MKSGSNGAKSPHISVVVATRNRPGRLRALLSALRAQALPRDAWEVIIVDDASNDRETEEILARAKTEEPFQLRTIRSPQQGGPASARERGWRAARGELIAFTDDDCEPTPEWLAVGASKAGADTWQFVQGRTLPNPNESASLGPYSRTIEVVELDPHFHTCNIFYPRALLTSIDGFDTDSFGREPGGEDSDLAWRAIAAGATPTFAPDALVFHAVSDLGPVGKLRVAARWTTPMKAFAIHRDLRHASFVYRIFWKREHLRLVLFLVAILLPKRLSALRTPLMVPSLRSAYGRAVTSGAGGHVAIFFLLHDLVETYAVGKAALRYRRLML